VDDLVDALRRVVDRIDLTAGQIYNLGGGPENTLSVWAEFQEWLALLAGHDIPVRYADWRPGDQRWYVSDICKAGRSLGWWPTVDPMTGTHRLWDWIKANEALLAQFVQPAWTAGVPAG
jgi:CDP-paratose 2-epimerase